MEPSHPATNQPLSALERTLWRFRMVAHEAQMMWRGFNRCGDVAKVVNEDLMFSLTNQALVIVCKFLEICNGFGALARSEPRVVPARRAIQPFVDRIQIWKGLDEFRNTTLAHAYLSKDDKLLPPWELLQQELAPSYHAEIVLLLQCVVLAVLGVLTVFEREYTPIDSLTGPLGEQPGRGLGIELGSEIASAIRDIAARSDELLRKECGVVAKGSLAKTFRLALEP